MKSLNELRSISDINFIEARGVENISCERSGHKKDQFKMNRSL